MNNYKKIFFSLAAVIAFIILFFVETADMTDGVRNGLLLCGETVIPSLFPFMVISDYLVRSGLSDCLGSRFSTVMQKLFHLPGCAACVLIMGLFGGFPVGSRMTSQLYENGRLSQAQAKRMLLFCVNSGPAFTIGAIGISMLSSKKCGIVIFLSQILTSLFLAFISRFAVKKKELPDIRTVQKIKPDCLVESVSSATSSMLGICAWILLFSSFGKLLVRLTEINSFFYLLLMMSEVTTGCAFATKTLPTYLISPVLCWAGISVHMQLLPYLKQIGMPLNEFWLARVTSTITSVPISWALFKFFPCETEVFSTFTKITASPFSVSVPASIIMLLLGVFSIADINLATKEKI